MNLTNISKVSLQLNLATVLFGILVWLGQGHCASSHQSTNNCIGLICLETVNVGDVNNPSDMETGLGAVTYDYAIGKHEVTVEQYVTFLNTVATTPNELPVEKRAAIIELWQSDMKNTHPYVSVNGLIDRGGSGTTADPYRFSEVPDPRWGSKASLRGILNISWFSAARFANWLHNGATAAASTETGAYSLNYATLGVFPKNNGAKWWIPSDDEWYKAAFYRFSI